MLSDWKTFTLAELRGFARSYHRVTKIVGVGKLKREELVAQIDKHLTVGYDTKGNHQISLKIKPESVEYDITAPKETPKSTAKVVKVERMTIKDKKSKPKAAEPAMPMKKPIRSTKV